MFYFPQQRRLIIKSLKANESRTKTLLTSVSSRYYQANRYNSPAWTPTLSYDSSLFVSVPSDSMLCDESGEYVRDKFQKFRKQSQLNVSIASRFYLILWVTVKYRKV